MRVANRDSSAGGSAPIQSAVGPRGTNGSGGGCCHGGMASGMAGLVWRGPQSGPIPEASSELRQAFEGEADMANAVVPEPEEKMPTSAKYSTILERFFRCPP